MIDRSALGRVSVRPRRVVAIGGALVASIIASGVTGCGEEPPPPEPVVRPVKMVEIGRGGTGGNREYPGQISPATNVEVGFEVAGKLVAFPVIEGQVVEEGFVIARLDPRDYQTALDASLAKAASAKADYDRRLRLFEEDVISKQELEKAQRNHEVAVADVKTKEKAVEDTVLRAPFDGTIARKIANDFDNVLAKQGIVQLQTGSALEIVVNAPEQDLTQVMPGLTIDERNERLHAYVVASAIPDRKLPARLKEFATTADPATRTFRITFSFDPPTDFSVLPGMTAKLVIGPPEGEGGIYTVPVTAVTDDGSGAPYVWRVDPDTMRVTKVNVEVGPLTGDSVEIRDGVGTGDLIVTSGVHQLQEGMQVSRWKP